MGDDNPYESPGATPSHEVHEVAVPSAGWTVRGVTYANPMLLAMGVILYVAFYFAGPILHEVEYPLRLSVLPFVLFLLIGMLSLMVGWAVASFQLVLAFVRLSQRNPIWIDHMTAVGLAIACYLAFILAVSNGIVVKD
jgi:hypothetical protein